MKLFLQNVGQSDEFKGYSHISRILIIESGYGSHTNCDKKGGLDSQPSKVQTAEDHNHNLYATERARTDRRLSQHLQIHSFVETGLDDQSPPHVPILWAPSNGRCIQFAP